MATDLKYDYLLIGAGIMGMTIAYELKKAEPDARIAIIEKEQNVAMHASGRNSGVLHAGFYYSPDSMKARFTRDGNKLMKEFCRNNGIKVNECKKVVVAQNEEELKSLFELERRGKENGVELYLVNEEELQKIEPNAKTYKFALFSPTTATVDPREVCQVLKNDLLNKGIRFFFNSGYIERDGNNVITKSHIFKARFVINCAGLYADKIARDFGFSDSYTIIPFKGRYLKYSGEVRPVSTNVYPVPNLENPFLGVHYTITSKGDIKIGPTAMPAFWRENYKGLSNFRLNEFLEIIYFESKLFFRNAFNFRKLAWSEIKKNNKKFFAGLALSLVKSVDASKFDQWLPSGIRAQLLNKESLQLEMDFIVEGDENSLHLLNAVSPAFTCSFALAKFIVQEKLRLGNKVDLTTSLSSTGTI